MRFEGRVCRDGKHWLAEVPLLEAMTQGRTRKEALAMIGDWIETMVNRRGFNVTIHAAPHNRFEIEASSPAALVGLMLRRRREARGLSLAAVARHLNALSRNAYARYERGEVVPSIDKLDELMRAVSDGSDFIIRESQC